MCLDKISERKIAGEDITCYKFLKVRTVPATPLTHGQDFSCKIYGEQINGKISIEDGVIYICNDIKRGAGCAEKFGYKYSWAWDNGISDFDGNEQFITPFQHCLVKIGETYLSELESNGDYCNIGLHSLKNIDDCKNVCKYNDYPYLAKCIIPKGAEYFEGIWHDVDEFEGYASSQLKYVELIKFEK